MSSEVNQTKFGSTPLVSVLMNCFNGEQYLQEAIDSVVAQTYSNWEIIFWDNQSTDRSASVVASYQDPRIKYYYAPTHTMLYEARNHAYMQAKGELIAFLDVDDSWESEKLQNQVPLFLDPKVGLSCCNYWVVNELKGKRSLAIKKFLRRKKKVVDALLRYYDIGLLTLVVRRSALSTEHPPFDRRFHIIGDFDMVIRLATTWDVAYSQQPLASYRLHGGNESIKRKELMVLELETWVSEQRNNIALVNACNQNSLAVYLNYSKACQAILECDRAEAFSYAISLPWCYLKAKALIGIVLPNWLAQIIF